MRTLLVSLLLLASTSVLGAPSVDDLQFMKGRWAGSLGPATLEETWNDPKAGTMVAVVRMSSPQGTVFVELIIISEENDTLVLRLQQFSPSYDSLPPGVQKMTMASQTDHSITFTSDSDEGLKKLTYTRVSENEFTLDGVSAQGPFKAELQAVE